MYISYLKHWMQNTLQLFFPARCALCGNILPDGVKGICLSCNLNIPRTHLQGKPGNRMEQLFWGKIPLGQVSAFSYYRKGDHFSKLIHHLKYHGRKDLGIILGRMAAVELQETDFFDDINYIIPVPLHPRKTKERGYNQSEYIAKGIAAITGIPMDTISLQRTQYTDTQTHQSADARWNNVAKVFTLTHPERFINQHILLIDDVLTTGATLTACADTFQNVPGIHISILTLGWADS